MIETSTPKTNSLQNDMVQNNATAEDLGEEEQSFYISVKKKLDVLAKTPSQEVIARILKYSKSA